MRNFRNWQQHSLIGNSIHDNGRQSAPNDSTKNLLPMQKRQSDKVAMEQPQHYRIVKLGRCQTIPHWTSNSSTEQSVPEQTWVKPPVTMRHDPALANGMLQSTSGKSQVWFHPMHQFTVPGSAEMHSHTHTHTHMPMHCHP